VAQFISATMSGIETVAPALSVELPGSDTRRTDWCKSLEQKGKRLDST